MDCHNINPKPSNARLGFHAIRFFRHQFSNHQFVMVCWSSGMGFRIYFKLFMGRRSNLVVFDHDFIFINQRLADQIMCLIHQSLQQDGMPIGI